MHEFFMKKSNKSKDDTETLQKEGNKTGQTGDTQKEVWSIKQMTVRAEIIATLPFCSTKSVLQFFTELISSNFLI